MELKDYQADVVDSLEDYLKSLKAHQGALLDSFTNFWQARGVLKQAYKNNVACVPHVCVKVPTAGGKTFIAVNALASIFNALTEFNPTRPRFVVWLVPSLTILEQTANNLADVSHPYHQKLKDLFGGKVCIYQKAEVQQGAGFNADSVRAQLSIVVMSFDSLKATNKENRKAYQENGYLASFITGETMDKTALLPEYDESALINVIRLLKPVVIVDESHNAGSVLSVEMLSNLNPAFILDLTATPRESSNIISYIDALRLKKQHMVKLPVIVANQQSQEDVIHAALSMRRQLEEFAKQAEADNGYIRPIVLFQAEPKTSDDVTTFTKIKEILLTLKIPSEQIAIKTANVNELKNIDLMNKNCPIRYIITVNALKEGWDCPFAYVLATLANKSSVVDVTQILGRVLRQPYVRKHSVELLNLSYVFTASNRFNETLSQVVLGLNKAGFSQRDYREVDCTNFSLDVDATKDKSTFTQQDELPVLPIFPLEKINDDLAIDAHKLDVNWESNAIAEAKNETFEGVKGDSKNAASAISHLKEEALRQSEEFERAAENADSNTCPEELKAHMNEHKIKPMFAETARAILLPQFFIKVLPSGGFFATGEDWQLLSSENLLEEFVLQKCDATFNFSALETAIYKVDAKNIGNNESTLEFNPLQKTEKEQINRLIKNQSSETQIKSIVKRLFDLLGKRSFYPLEDNDVRHYLTRIVEAMNADERADCVERDYQYVNLIKAKIKNLTEIFAAQAFEDWLATGKISLQAHFRLPLSITPAKNAPAIGKSLYVTEGDINSLEIKIIQSIADLPSVLWWHRNFVKGSGFYINGFLNHYPDFMVLTEKKNLILLETKGDDRDNSDSKEKIKLGQKWAAEANSLSHETGFRYHYFMVFEKNTLEGALSTADALKRIANL